MNWVLFILLQPCDKHEDWFKTKFNLEKNKNGHEQKKTMEKKILGMNKFI
jgi:hypothetical protein